MDRQVSSIHCVGVVVGGIGIFGLACSLMPTDTRGIPCAMLLVWVPWQLNGASFFIYNGIMSWRSLAQEECRVGDHIVPCWCACMNSVVSFSNAVLLLLNVVFVVRTAVVPCKRPSSQNLRVAYIKFFFSGGIAMFLEVPRFVMGLLVYVEAALNDATLLSLTIVEGLVVISMFSIGARKRFLQKAQCYWMSQTGEAAAAATISNLLCGREVPEVLSAARSTFKYVSADKVLLKDIMVNCPDPELGKLAKKGTLGYVDAFISHSWHDDPSQKWVVLQQWREDFKAQNGREPRLWMDNYCIDQDHIENSLACLPVCLAGVSKLVILAGETYLQRLWCLMEIFVFLEMGGDPSKLEVHMFLNSASTSAYKSKQELLTAIKRFDARNAESSTAADTARLQKVIEDAGYDKINNLVRTVFVRANVGKRQSQTPSGTLSLLSAERRMLGGSSLQLC